METNIPNVNLENYFHFDGHGINSSEGVRVAQIVCCEPYFSVSDDEFGRCQVRNPDFDKLGRLLSAAPQMMRRLRLLVNENAVHGLQKEMIQNLLDWIEKGPD